MSWVRSELPLTPEVALVAPLGVGRDDGYEQPAVVDVRADVAIPGVASAQLVLVKPHLDAACAERSCAEHFRERHPPLPALMLPRAHRRRGIECCGVRSI